MKSNVANIFVLFIAVALILCGCKEEAKSEPNSKKIEFCEGALLVHLRDKALLVPRTQKEPSLRIVLTNGDQLLQLHRAQKGYECDVNEIYDAESIRWPGYSVSVIKEKQDNLKGTYGVYEKIITELRKSGQSKLWDDGVEVLGEGREGLPAFLVLPIEKAKTLNGYPVVFICTRLKDDNDSPTIGDCFTNYFDPHGLSIKYRFLTSQTDPKAVLAVDGQKRKLLSDLMLNSKQNP